MKTGAASVSTPTMPVTGVRRWVPDYGGSNRLRRSLPARLIQRHRRRASVLDQPLTTPKVAFSRTLDSVMGKHLFDVQISSITSRFASPPTRIRPFRPPSRSAHARLVVTKDSAWQWKVAEPRAQRGGARVTGSRGQSRFEVEVSGVGGDQLGIRRPTSTGLPTARPCPFRGVHRGSPDRADYLPAALGGSIRTWGMWSAEVQRLF